MWMWLAACGTPDPTELPPPAEPVVVQDTLVVISQPEPVHIEREPVHTVGKVYGWGEVPPPCLLACDPLPVRVQASTVAEGSLEHRALDGDLDTAWCGTGSVGEKLALSAGTPYTVRRIHVVGVNPQGSSLVELRIVTDRGDRIPVQLPALQGSDREIHPPTIDLLLEDVQFVQLEVERLSGGGQACVAEVLLLGER